MPVPVLRFNSPRHRIFNELTKLNYRVFYITSSSYLTQSVLPCPNGQNAFGHIKFIHTYNKMIPTSVRYRLECEVSLQNNLQISYLSQFLYTSKGGTTPTATIPIPLPQPQLILLLYKSCSCLSKTLTSEIRRELYSQNGWMFKGNQRR